MEDVLESLDSLKKKLDISSKDSIDSALEKMYSLLLDENKTSESLAYELKIKNDFLQSILDNLSIGIAINTVSDGKIIYMNSKFAEIYGWPMSDLNSVDAFFEKVYPDGDYRKQMQNRIIEDINSGDVSRMNWSDAKITTKNGEKKIVSAYNIPLNQHGLMISTVQDVTDKTKLKMGVLDLNRYLETIIDSSGDAIFTVDTNGFIKTWNGAAETIYGYSKKEVSEKYVDSLLNVKSDARTYKNVFSLLELSGGSFHETEVKRKKKDGSEFFVSATYSLIKDADEILGLSVIERDISQMVSEAKILGAKDLITSMEHYILNAITPMFGRAQLYLMKEPKDSEAKNLAEITINGVLKVKTIIQSLANIKQYLISSYGDGQSMIDIDKEISSALEEEKCKLEKF
ncbi:MAG: PAS domain-containing protein [Nanoarchaeota archaeon]|nr:PAS domain-containing protein [Nanoarchaeota archaeon]